MKKLLILTLVLIVAMTTLVGCSLFKKEATITFDSMGGTAVDSITAKVGERVRAPEPPTRDGYVFDGWYEDSSFNKKYIFSTMESESITLYAKWSKDGNVYTITFDSMGGSRVPSITKAEGERVTAPSEPTKEGYVFAGWYTNAECTIAYTFDVMDKDITLFAKWIKEIHGMSVIVLHGFGGSGTNIENYQEGVGVTLPTDWVREGYTFAGWYDSPSFGNKVDKVSDTDKGNKQFYAKWLPNTYTITFDSNGGTAVADRSVDMDAAIGALPTPTNGDYVFAGWYDVTTDEKFTLENMPARDISLYAKWVNGYKVTYHVLGDFEEVFVEGSTCELMDITTSKFNNVDYNFGGWYGDSSYSKLYEGTITLTQNIDLYAKMTHRSYIDSRASYLSAINRGDSIKVNSREELINLFDYVMTENEKREVQFEINYVYGKTNKEKEIDGAYKLWGTSTAWPSISYRAELTSGSPISTIQLTSNESIFGSADVQYETIKNQSAGKRKKVASGSKRLYTPTRSASYDNFKYKQYAKSMECSTSNELFYALEHGIKPVCKVPSEANRLFDKAKDVLREICDDSMTDLEKTYAIYDWFIANVYYDFTAYNVVKDPRVAYKYNSWHMDGVFDNNMAICDGISKAFTVLARTEGIPCIRLTSYNHAWNKVYLDVNNDGIYEWYGVDATWANSANDTYGEVPSMADFLFTDAYKASKEQVATNYQDIVADTEVNQFDLIDISKDVDLYINSEQKAKALAKHMFDVVSSGISNEYISIDIVVESGLFVPDYSKIISDELSRLSGGSIRKECALLVTGTKGRQLVLYRIK